MILTSHVGSLPFLDIKQANAFNEDFDLPVLFSLPKVNESELMLNQVLGLGSGTVFSQSIVEREIVIKNIDSICKYDEFKFQMVGPITLIKSFKQISNSEIEALLYWYQNQLSNILDLNVMKRCYFFLDEPMLFMANVDEYEVLNSFLSSLTDKFLKLGVHCCSEFKPDLLDFSFINGLSFESKYFKENHFPEHIDLFLGVLDTQDLRLDSPLSLDNLPNKLYVTPHCGLALSMPEKMNMVSKKLTNWIKMTSLY